jgi:predicted DNA-binding protein (MmcQ/YjbR family)
LPIAATGDEPLAAEVTVVRMDDVLARLRKLCLDLPEAMEKVSHGEPVWFVRKRSFVMFADHHHDDRVAFWCAAPLGAQEELVDDERYFRPPYVGHRGWLGVYLDVPLDWDEVAEVVRDAYRVVAPKSLGCVV